MYDIVNGNGIRVTHGLDSKDEPVVYISTELDTIGMSVYDARLLSNVILTEIVCAKREAKLKKGYLMEEEE